MARPKRRPKPCTHPSCQHQWAEPLTPGRRVCASCAARIDKRAKELREKQARKDGVTVDTQSGPADAQTSPTHDREVSPDA